MLLVSLLNPKWKFFCEGSGDPIPTKMTTLQQEMPTPAAAQPANPSVVRSPWLCGQHPGLFNYQDPQESTCLSAAKTRNNTIWKMVQEKISGHISNYLPYTE